MVKEQSVICIGCPAGCKTRLSLDEKGEVVEMSGNKCKEGEKYVLDEFKNPCRVLTATMLTKESVRNLLPVRTNKPIPKNKLKEAMYALASIKVSPPLKKGQIVVSNILNTGVNLIAADELLA